MRFSLLTIVSLIVSAVAASEQELQQLNVVGSRILHSEQADTTAGPFLEHYGPPTEGCDDDEMAFQISGIPGGVCARKCTDFLPCPTDVPDGVSATPMCALQDPSTGNQYCILVCRADSNDSESRPMMLLRNNAPVLRDDQCGDAICRPVEGQNGLGICTYDV